jgi:hypothetical protein
MEQYNGFTFGVYRILYKKEKGMERIVLFCDFENLRL